MGCCEVAAKSILDVLIDRQQALARNTSNCELLINNGLSHLSRNVVFTLSRSRNEPLEVIYDFFRNEWKQRMILPLTPPEEAT
jgi:hypothetical protein